MTKKLMLFAMAAGALAAFAAPAAAQADELVETVGGVEVPLEIGAEITLTSSDLKTVIPLGTLECKSATLHGEIIENGPTNVSEEETSTTVEECNKEITHITASTITLGGGSGSIAWGFVMEGFCTYTGSIPFKYDSHDDEIVVTGSQQLTGSPSFPCGKMTMSASFTLETSDGTPIYIS